MSAAEYLQLICPALYSDSSRSQWIAMAGEELSSCFFGSSYQKAIALYAAHQFTLAHRPSGDAGVITSKKEGGLSVSYDVPDMEGGQALELTHYGLQLRQLRKSRHAGVSVIGSGLTICGGS